jgi:hypothetical protein
MDMLFIEVKSTGHSKLTFSKLSQMDIPLPENGANPESNDNVVLSFEDEQEAVDYKLKLDRFLNSLDEQDSAEYLAANDMVNAINNDEFVRAYMQS